MGEGSKKLWREAEGDGGYWLVGTGEEDACLDRTTTYQGANTMAIGKSGRSHDSRRAQSTRKVSLTHVGDQVRGVADRSCQGGSQVNKA